MPKVIQRDPKSGQFDVIDPDSADEDDFKYSSDPVWKKVYKELFLPHYQEYLDNPTYFYDMTHYYENSDGLALYNPSFIVV